MSSDRPAAAPSSANPSIPEERPTLPAMMLGWQRKCPNCASGDMFRGYLKVRDACQVCHEDLHFHRADDAPAYLTILIVGHVMAPIMFYIFTQYRPDPLVMFSILTVGCVALSLYILPRLKGAVVAIQWAKRMHGF